MVVHDKEVAATRSNSVEARDLLERAVTINPDFAAAHASIASSYLNDFANGWAENPDESLQAGLEIAERAVQLDESDPEAHEKLAIALFFRREAPLYHSAPCVSSLMIAQFGAWLRLEPRFDAQSTLSTIERLRVTHPYLVPTMYVRLLRLPQDVRNKYDLSSVKFVRSTGAPCPPDVKQAMIDWWGDVINETYASSETGYLTAISSAEARHKPGSAGRPLEGVSIKILDDTATKFPPV